MEAERIAKRYAEARDEPVAHWDGVAATESRLKSIVEPPRVLHLATHGYYLTEAERPMMMSALLLAGANKGASGPVGPDSEDGILFAIEAMGLNLQGVELVVMSACDTASGWVDYSEGVYGLGRAFRIAGAENVLMTLWQIEDRLAMEFMVDFYDHWLSAPDMDPAIALRATQLQWIADADPLKHDPAAWAPYILLQNGL